MIKNRWLGKFLLAEGLDGSGKTSVIISALNCQNGAKFKIAYLKSVGSATMLGSLARRTGSTFFFLLELVYITWFRLYPILKTGKSVLMDKYYFSVASHIPETKRWYNKLLLAIFSKLLIRPDKIIYFKVDEKERIERLRVGTYNPYHEELIKNPQLIKLRTETCLREILDSKISFMYLNTTGLKIEQSARKLVNILGLFEEEEKYAKKRHRKND